MPMDKARYPADWKKIAQTVKEKAGWVCQGCGMQCRRPGEPFDTHRRTLTVHICFFLKNFMSLLPNQADTTSAITAASNALNET